MSEEIKNEQTETTTEDQSPIIHQIKTVLDKLAVFIQKDGGDIKFHSFDPQTGTVYVTLSGACQGCMYIDQTMTLGVEAILQEEVKGVNQVRVIDPTKPLADQIL